MRGKTRGKRRLWVALGFFRELLDVEREEVGDDLLRRIVKEKKEKKRKEKKKKRKKKEKKKRKEKGKEKKSN